MPKLALQRGPSLGATNVSVTIRVQWLLLLLLLPVAMIVAYPLVSPASQQALVFAAGIVGGTAALIAAASAIEIRSARLQQSQVAEALAFIKLWLDPQFFHAKTNGREILKEIKAQHGNVPKQKELLDANPQKYSNLTDILNFFEALSVAIQVEAADNDTARRFFRSLLMEYWHVMREFIEARRADRQNDRLLRELQWLFSDWTKP